MTDLKMMPFSEMSEKGVLWFINRMAFHPLGFALTFMLEEDGSISGWCIQGDGTECWTFEEEVDDRNYETFWRFIAVEVLGRSWNRKDARTLAEVHMGDGDELGVIARRLLEGLDGK